MISISNKEINPTDIGWFGEDGSTQVLAIKHGFTTEHSMMEIAFEWDNFTVKLKDIWTPEKLKDYMLKRKQKIIKDMREQYKTCNKKITDLELQNRDARVRGMSFKDRKAITDLMKKTQQYRDGLKDRADNIKRLQLPTYNVLELIERDEMGVIADHGLEQLLDVKYPTEYLLALNKLQ